MSHEFVGAGIYAIKFSDVQRSGEMSRVER